MRTSSTLALVALAALGGACGKSDKAEKSGGGAGAGAPVDKACADKRAALQKVFDQTAANMKTSPLHEMEHHAVEEIHAGRETLVPLDQGAPIDPRSLKIVMVGKTGAVMVTRGAMIDLSWDAQVDPNADQAAYPGEVIPDEPLVLWLASDLPRTVAMNFLRRAQKDRLGQLRVAYRLKSAGPGAPAEHAGVTIVDVAADAAREATRACPSFARDIAELAKAPTIDAELMKKLSADIGSCNCDFDPKLLEPIALVMDQPQVTFVPVMFGEKGAAPSEEGATWADAGPAFAKLALAGPIRFPEPAVPAPPQPARAK